MTETSSVPTSASGDANREASPEAGTTTPHMETRLEQFVVATSCIALSALWCWGALTFEIRVEQPGIGPRTWPLLIGGGAMLLSLTLLVRAAMGSRALRDSEKATRFGLVRVATTVGLTALALVAWKSSVHYALWMPSLIVSLLLVYGARGWKGVVLVPVVVMMIVYLLFDLLLKVPL